MKTFVSIMIVCLLVISCAGQDPLKTLPDSYKLDFENGWVKVVRVHYAPHQKLPAHAHTEMAAAYIYLNDGGPVIFKHIGLDYGAVTRPATKAGSFRLYRALTEIHEVENTSELPSDFLRVEFKTEALNQNSLRGRYYREEHPTGENFQKVQFENEQVRVTRLVCAPGKTMEISSSSTEPTLLVAVSRSRFNERTNNKNGLLELGLGQSRWVDINETHKLENAGDTPAELLRFSFKTKPLPKESINSAPHKHPAD